MMSKSLKKFLELPNPNFVEDVIIQEEKQFKPSFVAQLREEALFPQDHVVFMSPKSSSQAENINSGPMGDFSENDYQALSPKANNTIAMGIDLDTVQRLEVISQKCMESGLVEHNFFSVEQGLISEVA